MMPGAMIKADFSGKAEYEIGSSFSHVRIMAAHAPNRKIASAAADSLRMKTPFEDHRPYPELHRELDDRKHDRVRKARSPLALMSMC